ncbi:MAG: hypothetical protein KZQ78_14540, partial [Candidatus Thiodiazotropha sp. (ex Ustalcina ferruginea)]|nr:hypothetical protein [Candidatus Thiodiazotropha sp. (ex Ustalcina ferruginea)]
TVIRGSTRSRYFTTSIQAAILMNIYGTAVTNGEPAGAIKTYLDWVKSDVGQCILLKKGYAPTQDVDCS